MWYNFRVRAELLVALFLVGMRLCCISILHPEERHRMGGIQQTSTTDLVCVVWSNSQVIIETACALWGASL